MILHSVTRSSHLLPKEFFHDETNLRFEQRTDFFGAKEGDEEVKCTNTTLHSTNCIKSCTAEGILPRRDNFFGLSKRLLLLTERKGRGSKARKYIRCNVGSCSAPSPTSPGTRHNVGDSVENAAPRSPCGTAGRQSGRHNPSVVRTTPPLEAKPKKSPQRAAVG